MTGGIAAWLGVVNRRLRLWRTTLMIATLAVA